VSLAIDEAYLFASPRYLFQGAAYFSVGKAWH
jgi:hypothetical protein